MSDDDDTIIGKTFVSARPKTGRRWMARSCSSTSDHYRLRPLGDDVWPAQDEYGRMHGGVRTITVSRQDLIDDKKWRRA